MQKQMFADVLQNRCSLRFRKIHRKTPDLESLFNKPLVLMACNLFRLQHRCFPENFAKVLGTYFSFITEHFRTTASVTMQLRCSSNIFCVPLLRTHK